MKNLRYFGGAAAIALLAVAGTARANDLNEDGAWQFRNPNQTAVLQNGYALMYARNHGGTLYAAGSSGISGGLGTGGFGASGSATNNASEIINENINECSSSACTLTVSGGVNTVGQTTTSSSSTSKITATGNTTTSSTTNNTNNLTGGSN